MARKNLIEVSQIGTELSADNSKTMRPLVGAASQSRPNVSVGGITKSLQNMADRAERAEETERLLSQGQVIVELNPTDIDGSFVSDRMALADDDLSEFIRQIKENGQQVPILVRPHPQVKGRYQVSFGHRRLAACHALGIKVRAIIRDLSDEQLVVSQGQENSARTDLTYIERAYFALRLEKHAFPRVTIMTALGVDKAAISKMISLAGQLPGDLIEAIGPAPSFGRRRWEELAELISEPGKLGVVRREFASTELGRLSSDERFELARKICTVRHASHGGDVVWTTSDGVDAVRIKAGKRSTQLVFDTLALPEFDHFVRERLSDLYNEFKRRNGD